MPRSKTTQLVTTPELQIVKCTQLAVKVQHGQDEFWLPFSQIREPSESTIRELEGASTEMTIPEWLAKEKGIE